MDGSKPWPPGPADDGVCTTDQLGCLVGMWKCHCGIYTVFYEANHQAVALSQNGATISSLRAFSCGRQSRVCSCNSHAIKVL